MALPRTTPITVITLSLLASTLGLLLLFSVTEATSCTMGLLIPMNEARLTMKGRYYASAMTIAVEEINKQENLLHGTNISFIWNETDCYDEEKTIRALMYQIYEAKVSAVIGPACNCNTSARNAAAFNIPMISYMCTSPELSNKKLYPTFVRTYAQSTKIPEFLLKLLDHFKWTTVGILFEKDWLDTKDDIMKHFKRNQINIRVEEQLPNDRNKDKPKITEAMNLIKHNARIIIVLAGFEYAREKVLIPARDAGLTNNDYVFIMFQLDARQTLFSKKHPTWWFSVPTEPKDPFYRCKYQQAFDSVLVIATNMYQDSDKTLVKFQNNVKERSPDAPFYSNAYKIFPTARVCKFVFD